MAKEIISYEPEIGDKVVIVGRKGKIVDIEYRMGLLVQIRFDGGDGETCPVNCLKWNKNEKYWWRFV